MVALLSKDNIQSRNIDTVEKALVFGALILRASGIGQDNANTENILTSIEIVPVDKEETLLSLAIYLPYDAYTFNASGGLLLDNIQEFSDFVVVESDLTLNSLPNSSGITIPDYDESIINTFEKYLIYYSQILWSSVEDSSSSTIEISSLENQENAQVLISANLPFNLKRWLSGNNYLDSVLPVITGSNSPSGDDIPSEGNQINSYYVSFDSPGSYSIEEFHTVTRPGIVDSINITADYDTSDGIYDTYFYLNGVEILPEEIIDYEDGSYDVLFDTGNSPIFLEPGDVLAFELYEEPEPSYMDINIYILEGQI